MKSFTVLAITAALATTAVSAYQQEGGHEGGHGGHHSKPDLSGPGIQVETRPPVVVVKTVTLTKSWNARPTGKPHWKSNKHHHEDKDEDEHEHEDDKEEGGKKKWGGKGRKHGGKGGDDEDDEGKDDEDKDDEDKDDEDKDDLHANSLASVDGIDVEAGEASALVDFAAAQASGGMVSSAVAARTSSAVSKVSSAIASASSSAAAAVSPNAGESLRAGGTFVAAAAGIAAYLLL